MPPVLRISNFEIPSIPPCTKNWTPGNRNPKIGAGKKISGFRDPPQRIYILYTSSND